LPTSPRCAEPTWCDHCAPVVLDRVKEWPTAAE
jgi:hypothetical protein